jgi:hypothetical protein
MIIIGIDPGNSGALTKMFIKNGSIITIDIIDMPIIKIGQKNQLDGPAIRDFIASSDHIFIESSQAMPRFKKGNKSQREERCPVCGQEPSQGIVSTGSYLKGAGILIGICIGLKISYTEVHPKTWKAAMMRDMPKEKGSSILRCKQLFPSIILTRKKDHGKADSCLIAEWGRQQYHLVNYPNQSEIGQGFLVEKLKKPGK